MERMLTVSTLPFSMLYAWRPFRQQAAVWRFCLIRRLPLESPPRIAM